MGITVDNVVQFKLFWRDALGLSAYLNILKFRATTGLPDTPSTYGALFASFDAVKLARMVGPMRANCKLTKITLQKIAPTVEVEREFDPGSLTNTEGAIVFSGSVRHIPQLSAAFTLKSYVPGRKGVGHFYLPAVSPERVTLNGWGWQDDTDAEMQAVKDCLIDPLGISGTPAALKPIVTNATGTDVTSLNDVMSVRWTGKPVYHKLREVGRGM